MSTPTKTLPSIAQPLEQLLALGRERAATEGRPVLVSLVQRVDWPLSPVETFAAGKRLGLERAFWGCPSERFRLVGLDTAATIALHGPEPILQSRRVWRRLLERAVVEGEAVKGTGPLLLGGYRFDPLAAPDRTWDGFPDARLILPGLLFTWAGDQVWLTANCVVGAPPARAFPALGSAAGIATRLEQMLRSLTEGGPPAQGQPAGTLVDETSAMEWESRVGEALRAIAVGEMSKVVLSRRKTLQGVAPFSVEAAIARLEHANPRCAVFAFESAEACFLGASPESLARLTNGEMSLTCMAGTTARGASPEADDVLARRLLADSKERREHAAVVGQVAEGVRNLCSDLYWDACPKVARLGNVQHLATSFFGRVLEGKDLLDLAAALHPTPAVGGAPKAIAREAIRRLEGDRGWYGAPVGWVDAMGEGELWVGIRSALVRGDRAVLFAG
ncbi:MAG: isochorismate synthase, partial [Chloroflexi bacterium]|nr:isochorismate synthase [Chloroflexota bacterium]